jgi:hypothetical protein
MPRSGLRIMWKGLNSDGNILGAGAESLVAGSGEERRIAGTGASRGCDPYLLKARHEAVIEKAPLSNDRLLERRPR